MSSAGPVRSRPYAEVIGDPVAHSKSPTIHNFWLGLRGIAADYERCHVRPQELTDYFVARRADPLWRGCNVTIPHKQAVMTSLDEIAPRAAKVGAVNTVWRDAAGGLHGTNTDVDGVSEALRRAPDLAGRTAVVLGAGGAARAAFAHLEALACASVRVVARDHRKAAATLDQFELPAQFSAFDDSAPFAEAAVVINATQLGMTGQAAMPRTLIDGLCRAAPDCLVFDMVYAPLETPLLKAARSFGLATSDGLEMLIGQAARAFELFFGASAPRERDVELRRLLTP